MKVKRKDIVCDVCGRTLYYKHGIISIKAKKGFDCWEGSGWDKITIDICPTCADMLKSVFKEEVEKRLRATLSELVSLEDAVANE